MGLRSLLRRRNETRPSNKPLLSGVQVIRLLCVFLLVLNILVLSGILFSSRGIWGYRLKSGQVAELENKVTALQRENQKFYRRIMNFKNDPRAQERLAREYLGWTRENELIVEFYSPERDAPP